MGKKKWTLQLVSPNGTILDMGQLGFAAPVQAHSYIEPFLRKWLESPDNHFAGLEVLKEDLWQGLLNRSFREFHGYRLVWGGNPEDEFSAYPNGLDLDWYLIRITNDEVQVMLSGNLPDNWHGLSQDERQVAIEKVAIENR